MEVSLEKLTDEEVKSIIDNIPIKKWRRKENKDEDEYGTHEINYSFDTQVNGVPLKIRLAYIDPNNKKYCCKPPYSVVLEIDSDSVGLYSKISGYGEPGLGHDFFFTLDDEYTGKAKKRRLEEAAAKKREEEAEKVRREIRRERLERETAEKAHIAKIIYRIRGRE